MKFLWPQMLWLLLAVPLLVATYVALLRRRKKRALRYASLGAIKEAIGPAQRDPRQFGGATEPQREAGPQRGAVVHVKRHPVDVVTTRNVAGVGACGQPVDP